MLFQAVDRRDVRMIQRGQQLRLAVEARHPLGVVREALGHDLERDVAPELRIPRAIHFAHPARAK